MKERIAKYYRLGIWSEEKVRQAVERGQITEEDFKEITGKDY